MAIRLLGTFRWLVGLGIALLLVPSGWRLYNTVAPHKQEVGFLREQVADDACKLAANAIHNINTDVRRITILPFANDPSGYVTKSLRAELEKRGKFELLDKSLFEKLSRELGLRQEGYKTLKDAVRAGNRIGVEGIIFGEVNLFEQDEKKAKIDLDIRFVDLVKDRVLYSSKFLQEFKGSVLSTRYVSAKLRDVSVAERLVVWVLAVVLIPLITISFGRAMVRKKSNRANAVALGIYSLINILFIILLFSTGLTRWWTVLLLLGAILLAFAYNVAYFTFLTRLEE